MKTRHLIKGIHHVTATVDDAQEDCDFYINLLGLRLVKKTVNFDNNQVYHFYYGNATGEPGTIMTTFPYKGQNVRQGLHGTGQVAITAFSAPRSGFDFWRARLRSAAVLFRETSKFGQPVLQFSDPSGLKLELVGVERDDRKPWLPGDIPGTAAIRGIHSVSLSIAETGPTFEFLREEFGFSELGREGNITRFALEEARAGQVVDVIDEAGMEPGKNGIGTVHHVAWRVEHDEALLVMRNRLMENWGFQVTEVKDRNYFHSIYFRIPGQVLFEIATIPPGFLIDESFDQLGKELKLPAWEEVNRKHIEGVLPKIKV